MESPDQLEWRYILHLNLVDQTNLSIVQNLEWKIFICMLNDKVECFLCNNLIKDCLVLFVIEQCVLSPDIHHKKNNNS